MLVSSTRLFSERRFLERDWRKGGGDRAAGEGRYWKQVAKPVCRPFPGRGWDILKEAPCIISANSRHERPNAAALPDVTAYGGCTWPQCTHEGPFNPKSLNYCSRSELSKLNYFTVVHVSVGTFCPLIIYKWTRFNVAIPCIITQACCFYCVWMSKPL